MKNKRSSEVSNTMERVHSREQYLGKGGGLKEYKGSSGGIWREDEYISKITREVMDRVEKKDFKREKLLEKYMAKMLYG